MRPVQGNGSSTGGTKKRRSRKSQRVAKKTKRPAKKNKKTAAEIAEINRRSIYWTFTINNHEPEDIPEWNEDSMIYLIYGQEEGSEEETPHLQCFVIFKQRKRRTQLVKIFPRASVRVMYDKATPQHNRTYCSKDMDFTEFGVCPISKKQKQAEKKKQDWEAIFTSAQRGDLLDIPRSVLIRHYHAFKRINQDYQTAAEDLEHTTGVWIYGRTNCGKTTYCKTIPNLYRKNLNKWWDSYRGEDNVLLDEVDHLQKAWISTFLKIWGDRFAFPAEHKGTQVSIRPKRIFVTSQSTIRELFPDFAVYDAIERRFVFIDYENVRLDANQAKRDDPTYNWKEHVAEIIEKLIEEGRDQLNIFDE